MHLLRSELLLACQLPAQLLGAGGLAVALLPQQPLLGLARRLLLAQLLLPLYRALLGLCAARMQLCKRKLSEKLFTLAVKLHIITSKADRQPPMLALF